MHKMLTAWVLGISFALLPSYGACEETPTKKLKFGAPLSLTGDAANNGDAIRKGILLATEDLKAKGWEVNVGYQDDGTNPTKTVSATQFLINQGYQLFVGPTWSFLINAAAPLLEKTNTLAVVPAGSSDINGRTSRALFNLWPKRDGILPVITDWLKTKSYKKVYILTPLGSWGVVFRDLFQKASKAANLEIIADEQFDYGIDPTALKTLLLKAKSRNADLLLTTASGADLANMLKYRSNLKWGADVLGTEDIWDSIDLGLIAENDPMLNGTWIVSLPLNADFASRFRARFSESPKLYADRAYDCVMLLAHAVEKTDGSPAAVREELLKIQDFRGVTGEIKFDKDGDRLAEKYKVMSVMNNPQRN